jgi:quinol monooxygenase YgiN
MSTLRISALCLVAIFSITRAAAQAADDPPKDFFSRLDSVIKPGEPFQILAIIELKPGTEARFATESAKAAKATAAEPGCGEYKFYKDLEKPGTIVLFEKWKSIEALKSHIKQPYIVSFLKFMDEIGSGPKVQLLQPLHP